MTLADILSNGYGIDLSTLKFKLRTDLEFDNEAATEAEILKSINEDEIIVDGSFIDDFDIVADIVFKETNAKNINMQYKLKNDGEFLLGSTDNYVSIKDKVVQNVELPANSYKSYVLDWKWLDSSNDAEVGFDANSIYKLSIVIRAT